MNHFDAGKGIATKSINCEKMTDAFWFRKMLHEKPFLWLLLPCSSSLSFDLFWSTSCA